MAPRLTRGIRASGRVSRIADWPHLFGHIITATGWTRREVESLTLREANELMEYWSEHPPTHVLFAAMIKGRTPLAQRRRAARVDDKADLLSAIAGAGGTVSSVPNAEMARSLTALPKTR